MTFHLLKGEYMAEIISYTIHGRGSDLISVFLQPNSAEASVLIPDFYAFHTIPGENGRQQRDLFVLRAELVVGIL